jgi:predicted LPLAT superfamily acyltransferase
MTARQPASLYRLFRRAGVWAVAVIAWIVATGYFLFRPSRVRASLRFYRRLFPERSRPGQLTCVWRQFHDFARVFVERLALERGGEVEYTSQGWDHLTGAAQSGRGGVIVMSHAGNWEMAARLFRRRELPIMLFMGERAQEEVEQLQKSDLLAERVQVVASRRGTGAPALFNGVEGLRFVRSGGFVSISGDRLAGPDQRRVAARFLGQEISLPAAPYRFALLAGAPLFVFFAFRLAPRRYHIEITEPMEEVQTSGSARRTRIERLAQCYATLLEEAVRRHPFQWYHFGETVVHEGLRERPPA